jgi:hypothetical protein
MLLGKRIFIVGTGRSGTHFLCSAFQNEPDLHITVEDSRVFNLSVRHNFVTEDEAAFLFRKLIWRYNKIFFSTKFSRYLDKSHPNLWLVEKLLKIYPDAKFLCVQRGIFPTINSMLQHGRVLSWIENWKNFPIPNKFLGIGTVVSAEEYEHLSEIEKCALRCYVHIKEGLRLRELYPENFLIIRYEDFMLSPNFLKCSIREFADLVPDFSAFNESNVNKWRKYISKSDRNKTIKFLESLNVDSNPIISSYYQVDRN